MRGRTTMKRKQRPGSDGLHKAVRVCGSNKYVRCTSTVCDLTRTRCFWADYDDAISRNGLKIDKWHTEWTTYFRVIIQLEMPMTIVCSVVCSQNCHKTHGSSKCCKTQCSVCFPVWWTMMQATSLFSETNDTFLCLGRSRTKNKPQKRVQRRKFTLEVYQKRSRADIRNACRSCAVLEHNQAFHVRS